jgi:GNAT superfamily N-acetyltransferase
VAYLRPVPLERRHVAESFDSGEPALDEWITRHAWPSHAGRTSRVFVTTTDEDVDTVIGYYALSAAQVEPPDAPERVKKGQPSHRPIPVILLGRLAVDLAHQGRGVGSALLGDSMLRSLEAASVVGIRALLVHAKNARARDWYLDNGFEESPTDELHLLLLIKDIQAIVDAHSS